jgi:hypothetical protein
VTGVQTCALPIFAQKLPEKNIPSTHANATSL